MTDKSLIMTLVIPLEDANKIPEIDVRGVDKGSFSCHNIIVDTEDLKHREHAGVIAQSVAYAVHRHYSGLNIVKLANVLNKAGAGIDHHPLIREIFNDLHEAMND